MTFPEGVFIPLGILAYVILWRYIFLQFFELVKPSEDYQDSYLNAEPNFLDVLVSNCNESSDKNQQKSSQIVANIPQQKQFIVLCFELFSSEFQPERYVIRNNSFILHQKIYGRSHVLEEVQNLGKISDVHKSLKLYLRPGIGCYGNSIVTEKDKSKIPKLEDMEAADDDASDTQRSGNRVFRDIDGLFGTFDVVECHPAPRDIEPNVLQLGREEKDLNGTIRRLVAAELMKCCKKENNTMSRAHSDTNNRVNWKRNKYRKQAVNFHAIYTNGPPSFGQPRQTPEESICSPGSPEFVKKFDDILGERINSESIPEFVTEDVVEDVQSCDSNDEKDDDDDDDKGGEESVTIVENDASISYTGEYQIKKPSVLQNVASIEEPETQMIRTTRADTTLYPNTIVGKSGDASTQTEHMYMIRAVRSCPGRRRRLQLLGTPRGMLKTCRTSGKIFPIDISLPAFLYRKASDNLIYEMSKGSRSPSYIPVPERFRWRYVMPTRVN